MLLVLDQQRRGPLLDVLRACSVELLVALGPLEAQSILKNRPAVQVLITETTLRLEDWIETCKILKLLPEHVQIVTCCRLGAQSRHWIAALELGAYDVLVEPYEQESVQRVLDSAAARSYMSSLAARRRTMHNLWLSEDGTAAFQEAR